MSNDNAPLWGFEINTHLLTAGGALAFGGSLLALAGVSLTGLALLSAGRKRVLRMETSPRGLTTQWYQQAKRASTASAQAWHDGVGAGSA
jgi:hypothetical protein